ncbi:unnamed protein product [Rotaria sordida]|uniref:Uncharacterized protein n=1 Tax=Rotaria sordida TaxID=392033 RepID=A0A819TNC6_9BILA|nr:unnamed protein product [Rotaria sordida]CAF4077649.1 unnamed protein product [Rotaria sordida]
MLKKKLDKDECLIFHRNNLSSISKDLIKDSMKNSASLYTFDSFKKIGKENEVVEINEPIKKIVNELITKAKEKKLDAIIQNSITLAQRYFMHILVNDQVLDLYFVSNGKSYIISNIQWFCNILNNLFNNTTSNDQRNDNTFKQCQQIFGKNLHMISKKDFEKFHINDNELFDKWNIACSVALTHLNNDNKMFILLNSISSESSIPLSSVWSKSWSNTDYESEIYFHLLHPCDPLILFHIYKLFPSQKLLLVSNSFLLLQDGAIEILIQYHYNHTSSRTDISITFRALNLSTTKNTMNTSDRLIQESFQYVLREYYVIIWAFLFKNDYVFKIEEKNQESCNVFERVNGNQLMYHQWEHLALYHYSPAPTLTSTCTACGLRPTANKALYNSCTILSPVRFTTEEKNHKKEDPSDSLIFQLNKNPFSYTGKYNMRPDGCNFFEVLFLSFDDDLKQFRSSIPSVIQIGFLVNNFDIKDNEKILFEYGNSEKNEIQKFHHGLRLRIDILFTDRPNTYEFILSINNIPWSFQTMKCTTTKTMFQPFIQYSGIHEFERDIQLIMHYNKTELDKAIINSPTYDITKNPWKVGMSLEAKDRQNPTRLAVAHIVKVHEDNRITINFDGCSSTYDYTAEINDPNFHPCGYLEYVQRVLLKNTNMSKIKPHSTLTNFDKPYSYDRSFSWHNYLTEKDQEPVPFECFNDVQKEGMTVEYFPHGITKSTLTCLSCRHFYNVRIKYHKMNTIIQDEMVNSILFDHHVELANPKSRTSPGVVLLPESFDLLTFTYPCLIQFQCSSDYFVRLTCNHRSISPSDLTTIISGTHLINTRGVRIEKAELNMPLVTLCMLTAIDLSRNQVNILT